MGYSRKLTILFITTGAILLGFLSSQGHAHEAVEPVPNFTLPSLFPFTPSVTTAALKHPAIIHFFASWCSFCQRDHHLLKDLSPSYTLYGIVVADQYDKAQLWLGKYGNPYHAVAMDANKKISVLFAFSGVPSTIATDKNGHIVLRIDGSLSEADIQQFLKIVR